MPDSPDRIDAALATLVRAGADLNPGATITPRAHLADTLAAPLVAAAPLLPIAELPRLAVAMGGAAPAVDTDLAVTGVLGEGGMGRVLLARQHSLDRDVAVKIVKEMAAAGDLDRLLVEARVTGSLEHPGIVPVHALGRDDDGRPVMVMKRIEGVSWADLARTHDHPVWTAIAPAGDDRLDAHLEILSHVCNAIHLAHSRGVVHRDIKLDNVMIGSFGEVYVVDWGIATRVRSPDASGPRLEPLVGTPAYMAPEMVSGDLARTDARTDVYLLGATLHTLLTGSTRHQGDRLVDVLLSASASRPFAYGPEVPAELAAICNRAMSADPEARYPTALALRHAIADHRRHRGSIALGDEAAAKLAEIERLSAGPQPDARRVHVLMTECRFAFTQALREWKDNAAARAGLQRCLEAMIAHELAHGDAQGARQLLAELPEPRPALAARIDALETELRDAAMREDRLRSLEREQDPSVGRRAQIAILGLLIASALFIAVFLLQRKDHLPTRSQAITLPAVIVAVLLTSVALARRSFRTAISRRTVAMVVLMPVGVLGHRISATALDVPMASIFTADLWIGAVLAGAFAIAIMPRASWAAAALASAAFAATAWPHLTGWIFPVGFLCAMVLLLVARLGWGRAPSLPPPPAELQTPPR